MILGMEELEPAAARRQPGQARSRALVGAVMDAAMVLIEEVGVEELQMKQIAERAGVKLTAVYRYFPNKESIIRSVAMDAFAADSAWMEEIFGDVERDPRDLLSDAIRSYVQRHRDHPYRMVLRNSINANSELLALDVADNRVKAATLADRLAPASVLGRSEIEVRVLLFLCGLDGLVGMVSTVDEPEAEGLIETYTELAFEALKGKPPNAPD